MKKKILNLWLILLFGMPAFAANVSVQALQDFSTLEPSKELKVRTLDDVYVDGVLIVPYGTELSGVVFDIRTPKRLKQNAKFSFIPQYYINGEGDVTEVSGQHIAKYTTKSLDKVKIIKQAAFTAGNKLLFTGFSASATLVEGVVRNEHGNRLKSGVAALYESSPLSYIQEGKEIEIRQGDIFMLKFKDKVKASGPDYNDYDDTSEERI